VSKVPFVVRIDQRAVAPGPPTPGMDRRQLLDQDDRWAGWVRTDPGVAGGWHYHGDRDTYFFMIGGSLTVEFGPAGTQSVKAFAGDLGFVPAGVVHRETTGPEGPAEAFLLRIGTGPQNVNVDGPDPA
jgi:mannose-6-phosphate isomerase-like protein (cupin superfamily)